MRPGQQNKRGRGRNNNTGGNGGGNNSHNNNSNNNGNNNRRGANPLTRTYDSSGPDVKIRGTAQHIAEKYATLARDAQSSGDRVVAENYLQHAEHYNRIIAAAQAQMQDRFQRDERGDFSDRDGNERDQDDNDQPFGDDMQGSPDLEFRPQPEPRREDNRQQDNRQQDNRQNEGRSNEGRSNEGRNEGRQNEGRGEPRQNEPRGEGRAQSEPRQPRQHQPRPQAQPQPVVIDGTGPQPIIEGTPAEVAIEEATPGAGAARTPRRRGPLRPRRQPRGAEGAAEGDAAPAAEAPVDVVTSG